MSNVLSPDTADQAKENRLKCKLIEIETVPASDLPYRVYKQRTGVLLGSFATQDELDAFISSYPLEKLQAKPTRRRSSR